MRTLILLACLHPGLAVAGNLYRCVGQNGQVSYQSSHCAIGERTDRIIEIVPDAAEQLAAVSKASKPIKSGSRTDARRGTASVRKPRPARCAQAKAKREAQLQRLGLKRSFDDLSRIDGAVRAVCNGY